VSAARERWDDHLRSTVVDPVGMREISELSGASKRTVETWRLRDQLPEPAVVISVGPLWNRRDVELWLLDSGRWSSPGYDAVVEWSTRIHGTEGDRAQWGIEVAELLYTDGPDVELPPYPRGRRATIETRDKTVRRIFRNASSS
jgi:hypothetical protein